MKTIPFSLILYACFFLTSVYSQNPVFDWAISSEVVAGRGGRGSAQAVATDSVGNIYTAGWFVGAKDFDPGPGIALLTSEGFNNGGNSLSIFVQKLDKEGNHLWAFSLGNSRENTALNISVDKFGGVYISGYFWGERMDLDPGPDSSFVEGRFGNRKPFLMKVDENGNFLWGNSPTGGASGNIFQGLTVDDSANVYMTASFMGWADFDPDTSEYKLFSERLSDAYILKLDTDGKFKWVKTLPGLFESRGQGIHIDPSGNVLVAGTFNDKTDFDPGPDSLFLTGNRYDIFVLKLNALGELVWVNSFGANEADVAEAITTDIQGNIYVTGYFQDSVDFDPGTGTEILISSGGGDIFIAKYNSMGEFIWAKRPGGTSTIISSNDTDVGKSIVLDEDANVYLAGFFYFEMDFDPGPGSDLQYSRGQSDIFYAKYTTEGEYIWGKAIGSNQIDAGYAIALDPKQDPIVVGTFSGIIDFDTGNDTSLLNSYGPGGNGGGSSNFVLKIQEEWTVGVEDFELENNMTLYPNPVKDRLSVEYKAHDIEEVAILDLTGKVIYKTSYEKEGVDVRMLSSGMYLLEIRSQGKRITRKFMKY